MARLMQRGRANEARGVNGRVDDGKGRPVSLRSLSCERREGNATHALDENLRIQSTNLK